MKKEYIIPQINVSDFILENILTASMTTAVNAMSTQKMNGVARSNMHVQTWNSMN